MGSLGEQSEPRRRLSREIFCILREDGLYDPDDALFEDDRKSMMHDQEPSNASLIFSRTPDPSLGCRGLIAPGWVWPAWSCAAWTPLSGRGGASCGSPPSGSMGREENSDRPSIEGPCDHGP